MAELFDEQETALAVQSQAPITPLSLIQSALNKNVAPEVLKELVALQQSMVRFEWEAQERQSKIDFDTALTSVQAQIVRIAPNKENPGVKGGNTWYLSYARLDQVVRPLYTQAGFSVCFGEEDCPNPAKIRVVANVSRGGITRKFIKDVTPPLLGPKGEPVMTPTHGDTSANSYARRYLMYDIWNIAVGIDKDDNDGISPKDVLSQEEYAPLMEAIEGAETALKVTGAYIKALKAAKNEVEKAAFEKAANKRKAELQCV